MAVAVRGDLDRGVPKTGRHHLEREFESAVDAAVNAPAGVEVAQRVKAVFWLAAGGDDSGLDLRRCQHALPQARVIDWLVVAGAEHQSLRGAGQAPGPQRIHYHGAERDGALSRPRFRPAEHAVAVRPLPNPELSALEIDFVPGQAAQLAGA